MIISDRHRFAFIHIPKCAGTSVRKALRAIDETTGTFDKIAEHPEMGMVNFGHLTLADLCCHFPDEFRKITQYRSVAIVREPVDRFFSAVFQRLREFKGHDQSQITPKVVTDEAQLLIAQLQRAPGRLSLEYVHFNRQSDYIFNNGERIVEQVFPIGRMREASAFIEACTGLHTSMATRENQTIALKAGKLAPLVRMLRKPYSAIVPHELRSRTRSKLADFGLYGAIETRKYLEPGSALDSFVRDYYRRDFELYASIGAH